MSGQGVPANGGGRRYFLQAVGGGFQGRETFRGEWLATCGKRFPGRDLSEGKGPEARVL